MAILNKSLKDVNFENIFTEVIHTESLDLPNPHCLRMFCLGAENNAFSFASLNDLILDNIGEYVLSRAKIDGLKTDGKIQQIALKAVNLLKKASGLNAEWLSNELGNILLYVFLEQILGAPKLYNKIELLAHDDRINSLAGGGVHLLSLKEDGLPLPSYQMVFGKSNIIGDIKTAIDNAFVALKNVKDNMSSEMTLVENTVLPRSFDEETTKKLIEIIVPSKTKSTALPDKAFGVFLGYTLGLDPAKYSNSDFKTQLATAMKQDIKEHAGYIKQKINDLGMNTHSFYVYILPFNAADTEKSVLMQQILDGGGI
jgi:hypothetical protein